MLDNGAKIDTADNEGHTVLIQSHRAMNHEYLTLLLENGAKMLDKNRQGDTFLDIFLDYLAHVYCSHILECDIKLIDVFKMLEYIDAMFKSLHESNEAEAFIDIFFDLVNLWQWNEVPGEDSADFTFVGLFLKVMFRYKDKLPNLTSKCIRDFAKFAIFCRPNIIQFLILNGVYPQLDHFLLLYEYTLCVHSNFGAKKWNDGIIKFFIINGLLSYQEVQNVANKQFKFLDNLDFADKKSHSTFEKMANQPWPLVKLCVQKVSISFAKKEDLKGYLQKSGLPPKLERFVLHENESVRICPSQWDNIPIVTEPALYEQLPRPRPLLDHWPVGRDLDKCGCPRCGGQGLRFVGVEATCVDITESLFPYLEKRHEILEHDYRDELLLPQLFD